MFFALCWCSFALKYVVLASESFIILVLFCHCSSDIFKVNFGFSGYVSTSCHWPFFTPWEEGIVGLSRDTLGMFPLFLKRTADVMTHSLSVVFRKLVRLGSFPASWSQANVTPIPKDSPSFFVANYRPISSTSVLCKVFEHPVSVYLWRFIECSDVLPTIQFPYQDTETVWVSVIHFCAYPIICRVHSKVGRKLGLCRLIPVQPLTGLTIRAFFISSAPWVLEVLFVYINTVSIVMVRYEISNKLPIVLMRFRKNITIYI